MTNREGESGSGATAPDCDDNNDRPPPERSNYATNLVSLGPATSLASSETKKHTELHSIAALNNGGLNNSDRGSTPVKQQLASGEGKTMILNCDHLKQVDFGAKEKDCEQPIERAASVEALVKPTLKRYLMLVLYCLNSGNKAYQWLQVPSSTTKATILYDTDNYMINLCAIIFMVSFMILSWPACFIIEQIGIRKAVVLASIGTAIGSIIKCFSCHADGIWLLIIGQICVSLSEQLVFSIPTRLASVWFPDHQVSMCVAMCTIGSQLGLTLGFLVPKWFLGNMETREQIGEGFLNMFLFTAALSITISLLCVAFFEEAPAHPPGEARLKQLQLERSLSLERGSASMWQMVGDLLRQIGKLICNKQLMLLSTSYGIIIGTGYTIQTLLDQTIKPLWPDNDLIVGNTGFLMIIAGIVAAPVWGRAMDRWHAFKCINLIIAAGNLLALLLFAYVLVYTHSVAGVYIAGALYGAFNTGYVVSGLEYAVELTYPAPELVTSSIMNFMPVVHSTTYILICSYIVDNQGALATSILYIGLTVAALVFLLATRETLKRQAAREKMTEKPKQIPLGH